MLCFLLQAARTQAGLAGVTGAEGRIYLEQVFAIGCDVNTPKSLGFAGMSPSNDISVHSRTFFLSVLSCF